MSSVAIGHVPSGGCEARSVASGRATTSEPTAVEAMLKTWAASLAPRLPSERRALAAARQGWIDGVVASIYGTCARAKSRALEDLYRANLTAAAIPVIQGWLQSVVETGEVPA